MTSPIIVSFIVGVFIGFFLGLGWLCEIVDSVEKGHTRADYLRSGEKPLK